MSLLRMFEKQKAKESLNESQCNTKTPSGKGKTNSEVNLSSGSPTQDESGKQFVSWILSYSSYVPHSERIHMYNSNPDGKAKLLELWRV